MQSDATLIEQIKEAIVAGIAEDSECLTRDAVEAGIDAVEILNDALLAGADEVGARFESGEFFLPELMLTGRALKAAMKVVSPILGTDPNAGDTGVVVAATIETDIHDIGKNMVVSMLAASGFEVTDLGVDVPIRDIIARAGELNADVIACSALLTTSMPFMRDLMNLLDAMGQRDRFKVLVGGASVTPEFATRIGADGTASNAMDAVKVTRQLILQGNTSGNGA